MNEVEREIVANLEGQVIALRVMVAELFYALRTGTPIEHVHRHTRRLSESMAEHTETFFPDARSQFERGIHDGTISIEGLAQALNDFFTELGDLDPP